MISYSSLDNVLYLTANLDPSLIFWLPLNHCISALGLALTLNFIVTRVPFSLGTILGFSVKVGGKPSAPGAAVEVFLVGAGDSGAVAVEGFLAGSGAGTAAGAFCSSPVSKLRLIFALLSPKGLKALHL